MLHNFTWTNPVHLVFASVTRCSSLADVWCRLIWSNWNLYTHKMHSNPSSFWKNNVQIDLLQKKYRDCFTLSMFLLRFVKILIHHTSGKNTYPLPSFFLRNTSNTLRVRRLMDYSFYNHLSRCLVKHAWYNVKFHIFSKNASTGVYISGPPCLYKKNYLRRLGHPKKPIRNQPCNEKTLVV